MCRLTNWKLSENGGFSSIDGTTHANFPLNKTNVLLFLFLLFSGGTQITDRWIESHSSFVISTLCYFFFPGKNPARVDFSTRVVAIVLSRLIFFLCRLGRIACFSTTLHDSRQWYFPLRFIFITLALSLQSKKRKERKKGIISSICQLCCYLLSVWKCFNSSFTFRRGRWLLSHHLRFNIFPRVYSPWMKVFLLFRSSSFDFLYWVTSVSWNNKFCEREKANLGQLNRYFRCMFGFD